MNAFEEAYKDINRRIEELTDGHWIKAESTSNKTMDAKAELAAIHAVTLCIGCVKEAPESDPYTLRAVKQMAIRINELEEKLRQLGHYA